MALSDRGFTVAALQTGEQATEANDEESANLKHLEPWTIEASLHFNNWANMTKEDFAPVVEAFRDLHALFLCSS